MARDYGILHPDDKKGAPELMALPVKNNWLKYVYPGKLLIVNDSIIINIRKVLDIILCAGAARRHVQLNIELSGVCNLQCHYCSLDHKLGNRMKNGFMTMETLEAVFRKIIDNPPYQVNGGICFWNGGEPLLHPGFDEIVAYLAQKQKTGDRRYNFTLLTNGTRLTAEKSRLIIDSGAFNEIVFSIDGGNAAAFEKMRYPARWDKVSSNIHAFLDYREKSDRRIITRANMIFDPACEQFAVDDDFSRLLNRIDNVDKYYPQATCGLTPEDYIDRYPRSDGICLWLILRQYVILWDGTIGMCCCDLNGLLRLGGLNDFDSVYQGKKRSHYILNMLRGKRAELAGCSGCNLGLDFSGIWSFFHDGAGDEASDKSASGVR